MIHTVTSARNLGVILYSPISSPTLLPSQSISKPGWITLLPWSLQVMPSLAPPSLSNLILHHSLPLAHSSPNPPQGSRASLYLECPSRSSSPLAPSHSPDLSSELATSSKRTAGDPSNVASSKYFLSRPYDYFPCNPYLNLQLFLQLDLQVVLFVFYVPSYNVSPGEEGCNSLIPQHSPGT